VRSVVKKQASRFKDRPLLRAPWIIFASVAPVASKPCRYSSPCEGDVIHNERNRREVQDQARCSQFC